MNDLIERIEAASGPDRELDAQICIAIGLSQDNSIACQDGWCVGSATNPNPHLSPAFSASIDAAMSLIPRPTDDGNYTFAVGDCHENEYDSWACVTEPPPSSVDHRAHAATPALALSAAALKARAYLKETNNAD